MMGQLISKFIGRATELDQLKRLSKRANASLVVIRGRRRIGKSRLVSEFASNSNFFVFSGLAPHANMTAQTQRDAFARKLETQFKLPSISANDWNDLFTWLARQTEKKRVIILFDEITWMAHGDPDFLGKLKNAWDHEFSRNPKLMLVLCGSVSAWIEKNIISSTGFLGRPSLYITLDELPLADSNYFWRNKANKISAYEKLKMLMVTGGVPRYLELMEPALAAEENIRQLCFDATGPLFNEFDHIFADIYGNRTNIYLKIVEYLSTTSAASQQEISQATQIAQNNDLSEYLHDLELGGFISRDNAWHIRTGNVSKLSRYRLKDNYTRFYIRAILPNKQKIAKGYFLNRDLSTLPGWHIMLGLQFENLVLNNRQHILQQLGLRPEIIVFDNPYFKRATARHPGCQIDYMVQTQDKTLYVCEIKFYREAIGKNIINTMEEKTARIPLPRGFSIRPVLIHVNGVAGSVIESGYFSQIIDFGSLLQPNV